MGIEIIINGRKHVIGGSQITYEQIVAAAGKTGSPSMTQGWTNDHRNGREGRIVSPGQTIALERGLVFSCVHTGDA